ncbi:ABC transporter permease [bacterium]|nr:MAG: ABC transporter permease [bacterium]
MLCTCYMSSFTPAARRPRLVIRSGSTRASLDFKQIWLYRDLLFALSGREIKLRYRQTALGAIWVLLQPLLGSGILSFVFSGIAKLGTDGMPPFLFAYAGMLIWNLFNSIVSKGSSVLVSNSGLISKVYFPRLCLPLATVLPILIDLGIALALMVPLMVYYGVGISVSILLWPVCVLIAIVLALGIGLITSSLMVTYRDVQYVVPFVLNLLMFASPVAYSTREVPLWARPVYNLNPLVALVQGSRAALLGDKAFNPVSLLYPLAVAVVVFIIGMTFFRNMERKFADVI